MSKSCFEIMQECALHAGSDLNEPLPVDVRQHLTTCPDCRESYKQLRKDIALLHRCEIETDREQEHSCWPALSQRLRTQRARRRSNDHVNGWIAAVSISVACMALFAMPLLEQQQPTTPATMRGVMSELPSELLFQPATDPEIDSDFRTLEFDFHPENPRLIDSFSPDSGTIRDARHPRPDGQFSPE